MKWILVDPEQYVCRIRAKGKHIGSIAPSGGRIFDAIENQVVDDYCQDRKMIATRDLRELFRTKGMEVRCTDDQLRDFVKRYNREHRDHPAQDKMPVALFQQHIDAWLAQQPATDECNLERLQVLRDLREPVISEDRIYVPFASKGMLKRIRGAIGKWVKLVVDAKQNVVAKDWSILTLGFILCRQAPSWTRVREKRKGKDGVQLHLQTSTMQPVLQAIIHAEEHEVIEYASPPDLLFLNF